MIHGKHETFQFVAGADLSDAIWKVVTVGGTIAPSAAAALGVLVTKPKSGEHGGAAISGVVKCWAGGAITAGASITVTTSGWMTTVASGAGIPVGKALATAASGDLFPAMVNFANAALST
jgi:hypothetical protein